MKKVKIVASKDALQADYNKVENLHFEKGQCLENAKMVSKIIENCDIVEGIVRFRNDFFIRHAWNRISRDGKYIQIDLTAEKFFSNCEIEHYILIDTYTINEYNGYDSQQFLSDSDMLSNLANAMLVIQTPGASILDMIHKALPEMDCSDTTRGIYANETEFYTCLDRIIVESVYQVFYRH